MPTMPDIRLQGTDWMNINTLSGVAAGTAMRLTNKGTSLIMMAESATKPETNGIGMPLTPITHGWPAYGVADVATGSLDIWVRSVSGDGYISVQTVS